MLCSCGENRPGMVCQLCGLDVSRDDLSFDHRMPLAAGGPHSTENVQVAHKACNSAKGARYFEDGSSLERGRLASQPRDGDLARHPAGP